MATTKRKYETRYRMTDILRWDDAEFNRLSSTPSAQLLLVYLEQGPHTTPIPGVFSAGRAALAERKRWKQSVFDKAFAEALEATGFAVADWSAPLVWLPRAMKDHAAPKAETNVKAWTRAFMELPECDLKKRVKMAIADFLRAYAPEIARVADMVPAMDRAFSGEGAGAGEGVGVGDVKLSLVGSSRERSRGTAGESLKRVVGPSEADRCTGCGEADHWYVSCPRKGGAQLRSKGGMVGI